MDQSGPSRQAATASGTGTSASSSRSGAAPDGVPPDSHDTHRRARPRRARHHDPNRPQPPQCISACISSIEKCSDDLQECSDGIESRQLERAKRRQGINDDPTWTERGNRPDPLWKRKGIIPLVAIILTWVYIIYTWRVCVPAIQQRLFSQDSTARTTALTSRSTGIGLLVGFNILWLVTIWTYIKVVLTGPGFVKDHVSVEDQPPPVQREWMEKGEGGPYLGPAEDDGGPPQQENNGGRPNTNETKAPGHFKNSSTVALSGQENITAAGQTTGQTTPTDEGDLPVDPSLPAVVGPLGAGVAAAAVEEQQMQEHHTAASADTQTIPNGLPDSSTNQTQTTAPEHAQQHLPSAPLQPPTRSPPPDYAPLAPANRYCHRCTHVKTLRAHHCRHCGTCVLKMDHHCPWVGGCVGARNHKFFFHFVLWVTMLEFYVLISTAVIFSRGVSGTGYSNGQWTLDGFLISLFPICAVFVLFTLPLLITHAYLLLTNQTTLDHLAFQRTARREEVVLAQYFARKKAAATTRAEKRTAGMTVLSEKRKMKKSWDREWGQFKWEINLWKVERQRDDGQWQRLATLEAMRENWKQTMGDRWWMWILPIGRPSNDGLEYPVNPRHGPYGEWRKRVDWPKELQ